MADTTVPLKYMGEKAINDLGAAINNLGSGLLSYALALAAIGTIAMGLLEMVKSVARARMRYNRWRVSSWTEGKPILQELLLLAVGAHSDINALYDQPVEKMMGQIQAAAALALEYPVEYPNLYKWLTTVPETYWKGGAHNATGADGDRWLKSIHVVHKVRTLLDPKQATEEDKKTTQDASAARARLNNLIARKLDAFQNQTQYLWERLNQWNATAIAVCIFLIAVGISDFAPDNWQGWVKALILALPAGVVAPFAKQLAGSLTSFGK